MQGTNRHTARTATPTQRAKGTQRVPTTPTHSPTRVAHSRVLSAPHISVPHVTAGHGHHPADHLHRQQPTPLPPSEAQHATSVFSYNSARWCQLQFLKTPQRCMQPRLKVSAADDKCRMACVGWGGGRGNGAAKLLESELA